MKSSGGALPHKCRVAFAIRDDDTCFFTPTWMLDALYSEVWRRGFRVSLAVIPYVKATMQKHVPPPIRGSGNVYPISKNQELVAYLLEKIGEGYVDIVQHGCTHAYEDGKPEFAGNNFQLAYERLKLGRKLLEETFRREITVFAAPHDRISRASWRGLRLSGMGLCKRFTLGRLLLTISPPYTGLRELMRLALPSPNPFKPVFGRIVNVAGLTVIPLSAIFWSWSNIPIQTQLKMAKKCFSECFERGGVFVLLHHYWDYFQDWTSKSFKQDMVACLHELLDFVSSHDGVWKTTLSEIYRWSKVQREG